MAEAEKRLVGRPRMPNTTVINLRIQLDLLERLDRYIDSELVWSHEGDINRATVTRMLIEKFLDEKGCLREPGGNFIDLSGQI